MDKSQVNLKRIRALDYSKDPDPQHWKTINGSHVHLDGNGNYDGGAGSKFNGRHHYGPGWKQKASLMNRLAAALQAHECYQHVRDSWEEDKHPRDEDGRFTAGSQGKKRKRRNKAIRLPVKEYAHVMSEINTNLSKEKKQKKMFHQAIGNYIYLVKNNGFANYKILGKIKIK